MANIVIDSHKDALVNGIIRFLVDIGFQIRKTELSQQTFLPGITVDHGTILIDRELHKWRYIGVPMLQWIGLTADEKRAKEMGIEPYPTMIKWVLE